MADSGETPDRFYATVRLIARFWIWFFFRDVSVRHLERIPAGGPVLLCINHPNNLIDSLLIGAVVPRKVHYLATASLFRNAVMARFLTRCGVIPVYRRQDDPDRMDRNAEMFAVCRRAGAEGKLIAIYPEGTTHGEARVQRIKTGAARIALDFCQGGSPGRVAGCSLAVIPVGLSFEARKSFRARVLIAFGQPIPLGPHLEQYADHPAKAVDALTAAIQAGMEAQVVHMDRIDAAELVRAVEELYRENLIRQLRTERGLSPEEIDTFRLSRTIADAARHFETQDPGRVARLWQRIQDYRAMLAAYRVRDQAVQSRLQGGRDRDRLRTSSQAIAGFPIFAYGTVVSGLPYLVPRWLSRRMARKETDYATIRLLSSVVAFPLFWGLETWSVWRFAGLAWAVVFVVSLPISSLLAYHYLAGLGRLRSQVRFATLALTRHHAASRLLAEREAIIEELERAKSDYLSAGAGVPTTFVAGPPEAPAPGPSPGRHPPGGHVHPHRPDPSRRSDREEPGVGVNPMSILRLEELSAPALDALDRARAVVMIAVSPLEQHGPHLPVGVDLLSARHFAQTIAERLVATRPGWTVVLTPALPLGSFTFDAVGTIRVRQRAVRDVLVDYGRSLARAGFRHIVVVNGHAGPGHLVALEEAAAIVSRRHRIMMASVGGYMAWEFMRGRYLPKVEAALGRPLTEDERRAFSDDAHGGWFETSVMLFLRPDLVDEAYRTLPPTRYSLAQRLRPNFPLRNGGQGYVGHPAMANLAFAKATLDVLMAEATDLLEALLDGRLLPGQRRSPFFAIPFLRTAFWRVTGAVLALAAVAVWWLTRSPLGKGTSLP